MINLSAWLRRDSEHVCSATAGRSHLSEPQTTARRPPYLTAGLENPGVWRGGRSGHGPWTRAALWDPPEWPQQVNIAACHEDCDPAFMLRPNSARRGLGW